MEYSVGPTQEHLDSTRELARYVVATLDILPPARQLTPENSSNLGESLSLFAVDIPSAALKLFAHTITQRELSAAVVESIRLRDVKVKAANRRRINKLVGFMFETTPNS